MARKDEDRNAQRAAADNAAAEFATLERHEKNRRPKVEEIVGLPEESSDTVSDLTDTEQPESEQPESEQPESGE